MRGILQCLFRNLYSFDFFLFSCAVSDNNIYVRAFVYLVRVAGLIGITGILICLQIRLYRYKSALIEKEK